MKKASTRTNEVTDRRRLHFSSMKDIREDVEYLASGDPPRTSGNWSAAQIVGHVGTMIICSIDGFPVPRAPLPIRIAGTLLRRRFLIRTVPAGFKLPQKFRFLMPEIDASWDDEVERICTAIGRLDTERMTRPSPVLGRLTHEQWEQFHCRHAEMHFSFMHPS